MTEARHITDRAEWLRWRHDFLTASDIGAVLGIDPYRTPLSVYAEKRSMTINVPETPLMRRGRMFEAAAVEYLREEHPDWNIERPNLFYFDDKLRLGCTPDVRAYDPETGSKNIQIKTIAAPAFEAWEGKPLQSYVMQTVCENMLTDVDAGILAVLVVSTYSAELVEFEVPRHEGAEERIKDVAGQFWRNMAAGLVPRPDYHADADIIEQLYPPSDAGAIDLNDDNRIRSVVETREKLKAEAKAFEANIAALDAEIIDKLQGSEIGLLDGWKITRKWTHRGEFVVPAKDFPVLRVTRKAEGLP